MDKENCMIIGAGGAGIELLEQLGKHNFLYNVVGFIDDDISKQGDFIAGIPVLGGSNNLEVLASKHEISIVFIAIPSGSGETIRNLYSICAKLSLKVKVVPRISEIISGKVSIDQIKAVEVEDLLGRSVVRQDYHDLQWKMKSKVVIIFGAAGSIGSELCKQSCLLKPLKIICVDWWENGLFELNKKLTKVQNELNLDNTTIIYEVADIKDKNKIEYIFDKYKPDFAFNSAAYKHVPLMESNIDEAIKNNIYGSMILFEAAIRAQVEQFVLISTDKAVNPTNVMGATKRITEKLMNYYSIDNEKTKFSAVRFGNVLNSNGSVVPTFLEQIKEGQITVTHPDIIRYFMTISEAVQLVLRCWYQSVGNEIFILDMGEPVKIMDLAKLMIKLQGQEPYKDVDIKIIGLRPGEKLYEELMTDVEEINSTSNEKIFVLKNDEVFDKNIFMSKLNNLFVDCRDNNLSEIKSKLKELVPTYNYINKNEL